MEARGIHFFETAIGLCAMAWGKGGIVGVQLPAAEAAATRVRVARRFPEAEEILAPPGVDLAVRDIVRLLAGEARDLTRITLDMSAVPEFHGRVYAIARTIMAGETMTYGEVARRMGDPGAARAVGAALGQNPFAIVVPCHRVLAANGKTGGFSASGGVVTKLRLLTIERARTSDGPTLFDRDGGLPLIARKKTA
jgi:methylated-DNA-[protein]-cysteine S-methyltransferase